MKNSKRQLSWFQVDDTNAIAAHLEKMEASGWRLSGIDNWFYSYSRAEPAKVRYAVTFFPDASVYDPKITEGQETYADYCQAAGWELAAAYGPFQCFRSSRPDAAPIETDEAVKLRAIRRTMRKTFVLSYVLLLVMPAIYLPIMLSTARRDPFDFFSQNNQLAAMALMIGIVLFAGGFLLDYLVWVLRSVYAVRNGGVCAKPHTKARLWASWAMMALCAAVVAAFIAGSQYKAFFIIYLLAYGGVMATARWVLRWLKRSGRSRAGIRGWYFLFAIGAGVAVVVITVLLIPLTDLFRPEAAETYTYTNGDFSWTRDVWHDELPLTLEDLGYAVSEDDHCTYRAVKQSSPLASKSEYQNEPLNIDSQLPDLRYTVLETKWPWLLEKEWGDLTGGGEDAWPIEEIDPAPWGALEAYKETDVSSYYLRCPERVVIVFLSNGDSMEPWQVETIAAALAMRSE